MSDSSQVTLRLVEEVTFGINPGTDMEEIRFTSEGINQTINTVTSAEIRSDRQLTDVVQVGEEPAGNIDFELSYGAMDTLFPGALYSGDWPSEDTVTATDISTTTGANTIDTVAEDFTVFEVGQWVHVTGFTANSGENNDYYLIIAPAPTTTTITVAQIIPSTEAASDTVTVNGTMIRNGTTRKSYLVEKEFVDITEFQSFNGMIADTLTLNVAAAEIMTGSFGLIGLGGTVAGATVGTGSVTAAPTNPIMNASSNVGQILENNIVIAAGVFIESISLSLSNSARPIDSVGLLQHADIGAGTLSVTGNFNVYFADRTIFEKYVNGTETSLSFLVSDGVRAYAFTIHKMKFTNGTINAGGINQDIIANLEFTALRDPTTDSMIQIDRFAS